MSIKFITSHHNKDVLWKRVECIVLPVIQVIFISIYLIKYKTHIAYFNFNQIKSDFERLLKEVFLW